jgi:hypothetical protein
MTRCARPFGLSVTLLAGLLSGCASAPANTVSESLDERTGTTVTRLDRPLELVATEARGKGADPFAYVATFETNRMGKRSAYLWTAVPNEGRRPLGLSVLLDGDVPLPLGTPTDDPKAIDVGAFPYAAPTPWSATRAFPISDDSLRALAAAGRVEVVARYEGGATARFAGAVEPADLFARFRDSLGLR